METFVVLARRAAAGTFASTMFRLVIAAWVCALALVRRHGRGTIQSKRAGWSKIGCALLLITVGVNQGTGQSAQSTVLTNLQQVMSLSSTVLASNRFSAHFTGVVNYVSLFFPRIFVQEGHRAVRVNLVGSNEGYHYGQVVEVSGVVTESSPHPDINQATARILGEGVIPDPPRVDAHELAAGAHPFDIVVTRGVVRDLTLDGKFLFLLATYEGVPFRVWVSTPGDSFPRDWLDAEIEMIGMSDPWYNGRGRASGFIFSTSGSEFIRVTKPGSGTLFDRPCLSVAEASAKPQQWQPRYRIQGTVTLHRPGTLYVDDGTGAMLIHPLDLLEKGDRRNLEHEPQIVLEPGERVEVIGTRHNWFTLPPTLIFAEYRRLGRGPELRPLPVSISDLKAGRYPGKLVSLEARLLNQRGWANAMAENQVLTFQAGEEVFHANWIGDAPANWRLRLDAYYRVTGVNEAEGGLVPGRPTFELLLRSPADLVPVPAPPIWTRPQVWKPTLAAAAVGVIAAAWIVQQRWQLRRLEGRVAQRTADLHAANDHLRAEIVQRRTAEEGLRASEARKTAVLQSALDAIITVDQGGRILDFNPAAERTFGYPRAEALGRDLADLIIPSALRERHRSGLRRAVETGSDLMLGRRLEMPVLRRNGEEFPGEIALARIPHRERADFYGPHPGHL
jgi:PAS domain S-box-containing protein